jgi:hypothetical protein
MTLLPLFLSAILTAGLSAFAANAHDPSLHAQTASAPTKVPTTCVQLADTEHYSNDIKNPDIKALKTRCDAEKAAAARKTKAAGEKK